MVDASLSGRTFTPPPPYDVTSARVSAFAAATGTAYSEGGAVPVTFPIVVAFTAMRELMDDPEVGIDLSHVIHGEQRFAYERPVRVGDTLTATLTVDSLRQIGGADIIATSSAITDAEGALVCTARATLVPHLVSAALAPGDALATQTYRVTRADLVAYAEAAGDPNPIHQDETVARSVGLPGVIAHGMYTLALAARAVDSWAGEPGRVVTLGARFTKPVVVPAGDEGAEVSVAGTVKKVEDDLVTIGLTVTCGDEKVLGMPTATIRA